MPELTLRFQIAGGNEIARRLPRIALELDDFTEPLRVSGRAIYNDIQTEFRNQGQRKQPRWPALNKTYAAWKARHYPGKTLLRLTDALHRSLTDKLDPNAVYELGRHQLTIGTSLETPTGGWNLGLIHQLGAPNARWGPIPPRPMIRPSEATKNRIEAIFKAWLQRKAAEADIAIT